MRYIIYYIIFEFASFELFRIFSNVIFYEMNKKYEYLEWVNYFYCPSKNIYFYFYIYFIFTTSIFFVLSLFTKVYYESKRIENE